MLFLIILSHSVAELRLEIMRVNSETGDYWLDQRSWSPYSRFNSEIAELRLQINSRLKKAEELRLKNESIGDELGAWSLKIKSLFDDHLEDEHLKNESLFDDHLEDEHLKNESRLKELEELRLKIKSPEQQQRPDGPGLNEPSDFSSYSEEEDVAADDGSDTDSVQSADSPLNFEGGPSPYSGDSFQSKDPPQDFKGKWSPYRLKDRFREFFKRCYGDVKIFLSSLQTTN